MNFTPKAIISLLVIVILPIFCCAQEEIRDQKYNQSIDLYNRGLNLLEAETELEKAVNYFESASALNPSNSDFFYASSLAYYKLGQIDSAIIKVKDALTLSNQADYNNHAATLYFRSKKFKKASEHYTQAIKFNSTSDIKINLKLAHFNRGVAQMQIKSYNEAVRDFSKTLEYDPSYAPAFHNRGIVKLNLNQRKAACEDFRQAKKLGSNKSDRYLVKYCK